MIFNNLFKYQTLIHMKKMLLLAVLGLFLVIQSFAQATLDRPIPVDPNVKIGKLENGMTYYLRHNAMPANRLELRLVVNAGSILEDEDQQGLAHFTEHMAFNGTKHFSKNALIDFLERAGVRFGADLNAYTSFDETVYMLQLPTDRAGLVDSAFMVMEDWAHHVSMEGEEIDKERGVIREEWRQGLGADDRMRKKYYPTIFNGSKYADRLPIGLIKVIDHAEHDAFRRFYHDWYRPNLQAIVVVGDIDIQQMEAQVVRHFSGLKNPENQRERVNFDIPGNKEPLVAIVSDAEATGSSVMIYYKHPRKESITLLDYKAALMESIYSGMIVARLSELNRKPESPFLYAYSYYGGFIGRASDAYMSTAGVKENQIPAALRTLITENERVKQHGFTPTELERQKKLLLTNLEKQQKEKDKTPSSGFVREYTNHFLSNEPIPGIDNEVMMAHEILPLITLEEMNQLADQWITEENMVIVVTAPQKEGILIPEKEEVLAVVEQARKTKTEAYVDSFKEAPLLDKALKSTKVKDRKKDEKNGIETFTLANGAKLVIKTTDFKNDEILFSAFGSGETSLIADDQFFAAINTIGLVDQSGLGKFSSTDLQKKLTGLNVSVRPFIDKLSQGLRGSASPKDLETLLQLVFLYFEPARRDQQAFETFHSQLVNRFRFMRSNPQAVFYDTLSKIASCNSPRAVFIPSENEMQQLKPETMYSIYDRLFADAGTFTFVFTGNINSNEHLNLLTSYLGNLPSGKPLKWMQRESCFPEGKTISKIHAGTEYKSLVAIRFQEDYDYNPENNLRMNLLGKAYSIKLRENMREEIGGVYGVQAGINLARYPEQKYLLSINWSTNPDLVDTLSAIVFDQMQHLIQTGPSADDVAKVKETAIRERETNDKLNRFWINMIESSIQNSEPLFTYEEYKKQVEAITAEQLKETAIKFFRPAHYLRLVQYPAKTE